jgi:hypothetical protein
MENSILAAPPVEETGLLEGWLNRAELAHELAISVDTM